ncbi:MAG: hypothetical protein IPL65_11695 [Lewinellaceae bacterium]|nr:hypothetical protein [Lewinellaceae bacterium]
MYRWLLISFLAVVVPALLPAQQLSSIHTRWGDSFVEWEFFNFSTDSMAIQEAIDYEESFPEEPAGEMKLRWLNLRDDWTEWDFEYGDLRGTIKMRWKDDPGFWELRSFNGDIVSMRLAWPGDPTEWRVTDNDITLMFRSRWKNQLNEWECDESQYGTFKVSSFHRQDPRDWAIDDLLDERVPDAMRLAMVFLAVYQSSPKQ